MRTMATSSVRVSRKFTLHPDERIISVNMTVMPNVTPDMVDAAKRKGMAGDSLFHALVVSSNRSAK